MNVYADIIGGCWAVFVTVWGVSALFTKRSVGASLWRGWWVRVLIAALVIAWIFGRPKGGYHGYLTGIVYNPFLNSVGVVLAVVGTALAIWARYHLGRNWGMPMTLRKDPVLITSGPYAYIRNPIYTGVLLALLGAGFVNWWGLLFFVLLGIYFTYSCYVEERDMVRMFPQTYPVYKAHTKRLIPFVF